MSPILRLLRLGRSGRRGTALAVVLGTAATGAAIGLAGVSAFLIARAAEQPPVMHLMVVIAAVRGFGVGRGVLRYAERLAGHDAAFRVLGDLRATVVRRLASLLPGARQLSSGELSARFVREVDGLVDLWVRVLVPAAATLAVTVGAVAVSVAILPAAGLVLAGSAVAAALVAPAITARLASAAQRQVAPDRATYRQQVLEVLDGAAALTVDGRLDAELAALDRLDARVRASEIRTAAVAGVGGALAVLATGAAVTGALLVGARAMRDGDLGGPAFAVVVLLPFAVHEALSAMASVAATLPALRMSATRVVEVLDTPDPVSDPAVLRTVPDVRLGLRLDGVRVGWPDDVELLDGVTLDLPAGSATALVGPSGSGKSTLAALMMKFVVPRSGDVSFVDGDTEIQFADLTGDEVRRHVGWCAQDAHVFDSTVRANLSLARTDASDEQLWQALRGARLDAFVRSLPQGLDSLVGEHGRSLSGGERQRLALARVLLADRSIVVFDEPTEHVDDETTRELLRDLVEATTERTTIVITHRTDLVAEIPQLRERVVDISGWRPGAPSERASTSTT